MIDSETLAQVRVVSAAGAETRLGRLWAHQPVVLALLRHFG